MSDVAVDLTNLAPAALLGNGHFRFRSPTGALVFGTGPRSHGDHRAIKNLISHLRKAGAVLGKQQATHT